MAEKQVKSSELARTKLQLDDRERLISDLTAQLRGTPTKIENYDKNDREMKELQDKIDRFEEKLKEKEQKER